MRTIHSIKQEQLNEELVPGALEHMSGYISYQMYECLR